MKRYRVLGPLPSQPGPCSCTYVNAETAEEAVGKAAIQFDGEGIEAFRAEEVEAID